MEVVLSEPVELLQQMRVLAASDAVHVRELLPIEVARFVVAARRDVPADNVERACEGYTRELWLWVAGERTWDQCAEGLSGRISRRRAA